MPILDIGYREWQGERRPAWTRAFVVASTGISLCWRGQWLKRLLVFLTVPSVIAALFLGAFEQMVERGSAQDALRMVAVSGPFNGPPRRGRRMERFEPQTNEKIEELLQKPEEIRHFAWSYILLSLFRYPQAFGMVLIVGLVAPRMISYDLRSRGYLLYLSRPLTPSEYVFGKACIIYFLLFMVAAVPALLIYITGLFITQNQWAIAETWDIPLRILVATLLLVLPTTSIALAMSSMTQESRYAGFAWFALWVIGEVTHRVLWAADQARTQFENADKYSNWMLFSPYSTLGYLQQQVFGVTADPDNHLEPWILVIVVTLLGYFTTYWRVARMLKA